MWRFPAAFLVQSDVEYKVGYESELRPMNKPSHRFQSLLPDATWDYLHPNFVMVSAVDSYLSRHRRVGLLPHVATTPCSIRPASTSRSPGAPWLCRRPSLPLIRLLTGASRNTCGASSRHRRTRWAGSTARGTRSTERRDRRYVVVVVIVIDNLNSKARGRTRGDSTGR